MRILGPYPAHCELHPHSLQSQTACVWCTFQSLAHSLSPHHAAKEKDVTSCHSLLSRHASVFDEHTLSSILDGTHPDLEVALVDILVLLALESSGPLHASCLPSCPLLSALASSLSPHVYPNARAQADMCSQLLDALAAIPLSPISRGCAASLLSSLLPSFSSAPSVSSAPTSHHTSDQAFSLALSLLSSIPEPILTTTWESSFQLHRALLHLTSSTPLSSTPDAWFASSLSSFFLPRLLTPLPPPFTNLLTQTLETQTSLKVYPVPDPETLVPLLLEQALDEEHQTPRTRTALWSWIHAWLTTSTTTPSSSSPSSVGTLDYIATSILNLPLLITIQTSTQSSSIASRGILPILHALAETSPVSSTLLQIMSSLTHLSTLTHIATLHSQTLSLRLTGDPRAASSFVAHLSKLGATSRSHLASVLHLISLISTSPQVAHTVAAPLLLHLAPVISSLIQLRVDLQIVMAVLPILLPLLLPDDNTPSLDPELLALATQTLLARPVFEMGLVELDEPSKAMLITAAIRVLPLTSNPTRASILVSAMASNTSPTLGLALISEAASHPTSPEAASSLALEYARAVLDPLACDHCLSFVQNAPPHLGSRLRIILSRVFRGEDEQYAQCPAHGSSSLGPGSLSWVASWMLALAGPIRDLMGSDAGMATLLDSIRGNRKKSGHAPFPSSLSGASILIQMGIVLHACPDQIQSLLPTPDEMRAILRLSPECPGMLDLLEHLTQGSESGSIILEWLMRTPATHTTLHSLLQWDESGRLLLCLGVPALRALTSPTAPSPRPVLFLVDLFTTGARSVFSQIQVLDSLAAGMARVPFSNLADLTAVLWESGMWEHVCLTSVSPDVYGDDLQRACVALVIQVLNAGFMGLVSGDDAGVASPSALTVWHATVAMADVLLDATSPSLSRLGLALEILIRVRTLGLTCSSFGVALDGSLVDTVVALMVSPRVESCLSRIERSGESPGHTHPKLMAAYVRSALLEIQGKSLVEEDGDGSGREELDRVRAICESMGRGGIWGRISCLQLLSLARALCSGRTSAFVAVSILSYTLPFLESASDVVSYATALAVLGELLRFDAALANMRVFDVATTLHLKATSLSHPKSVLNLSTRIAAAINGAPDHSLSSSRYDLIATPFALIIPPHVVVRPPPSHPLPPLSCHVVDHSSAVNADDYSESELSSSEYDEYSDGSDGDGSAMLDAVLAGIPKLSAHRRTLAPNPVPLSRVSPRAQIVLPPNPSVSYSGDDIGIVPSSEPKRYSPPLFLAPPTPSPPTTSSTSSSLSSLPGVDL